MTKKTLKTKIKSFFSKKDTDVHLVPDVEDYQTRWCGDVDRFPHNNHIYHDDYLNETFHCYGARR